MDQKETDNEEIDEESLFLADSESLLDYVNNLNEELNIVSCGFAQKISSLEDHIKFLETQIIGLEFKLRNLKNE